MSVAWVGAGIAAVGVGLSARSANQQSGAAQDATNAANTANAQSTAAANRARQEGRAELRPYADRGNAAGDALSRLLGLGGGSRSVVRRDASGVMPGDANDWAAYEAQWRPTTQNNPTSPWHAYRQANMDRPWGEVFHEWSGGQYGPPPQLTAAQIAERDGQPAGDATSNTSNTPTDPNADAPMGADERVPYNGVETRTNPNAAGYEESAYGTMLRDAEATFEDSPYWQIANTEIDSAIKDLDGRYGASGLLLSGGATRARAEVAAGLRGEAFDKHYASRTGNFADYTAGLRDLYGAGLTAASGIASGGQVYANQVGANAMNAANTSANAAIASGQARQQGLSDALGFAGWAANNFATSRRSTTPATPISTVQTTSFTNRPSAVPTLVGSIPRVGG